MRKIIAALAGAALLALPTSALANCQRYSVAMIYATDCAYCMAAIRFFAQNGIVVDWEHSLNIGTLMNAPRYGIPAVPVIFVEGQRIVGFDQSAISNLLCIR